MRKINNNSQQPWRVINDNDELIALFEHLSDHNMWNPEDTSIFLKYGYKNINTGDKETYYALRDMARISKAKRNLDYCKVSLDYLSKALSTTKECQRKRIKNLEKAELVRVDRHDFSANHYFVNFNPNPDTTFVETIDILIKRSEILGLIYNYSTTNNQNEKIALITQIKELDPEGEYHKQFFTHMKGQPEADIAVQAALFEYFEPNNLFT
jgi:hypothetical protein